jgi:hypothetical protein
VGNVGAKGERRGWQQRGAKRAKNEGGLFEQRRGADPLILHRRDWNAAEIDSEKE